MINLSTNWILNWGPSRETSSCQSCPPPLFRTLCLIMRCGGVYRAYSDHPAFAKNHTDCKCKISETIQRGLTEMLQVEIVFFSPSAKGSASNTITKKANLARLHISTAEVKVYIDFQCMPMPELFFFGFHTCRFQLDWSATALSITEENTSNR